MGMAKVISTCSTVLAHVYAWGFKVQKTQNSILHTLAITNIIY